MNVADALNWHESRGARDNRKLQDLAELGGFEPPLTLQASGFAEGSWLAKPIDFRPPTD